MRLEITSEMEKALELLHNGSDLFLTGKANTGKTTLIQYFLKQSDRNALLTVPPGTSPLVADGYPLDQICPVRKLRDYLHLPTATDQKRNLENKLNQFDTIIIDQASTLSVDLFEYIYRQLKETIQPSQAKPTQLVLVGDCYQLYPNHQQTGKTFFTNQEATDYFFTSLRFNHFTFTTVQLTKVFPPNHQSVGDLDSKQNQTSDSIPTHTPTDRPTPDQKLTQVIAALRSGRYTFQTQKLLNQQVKPNFQPPKTETWITLTDLPQRAKQINRKQLRKLKTPSIISQAIQKGDLSNFPRPTYSQLELKIGMPVMLVANHPTGSYRVGDLGTITAAQLDTEAQIKVQIQLENDQTVTVTPYRWMVSAPEIKKHHQTATTNKAVAYFEQLPFCPAWALPIADLPKRFFPRAIIELDRKHYAATFLYRALCHLPGLDQVVFRKELSPSQLRLPVSLAKFVTQVPAVPAEVCAVEMLTVSNPDGGYTRPVEIAVTSQNGDTLSTLINPQRDLADAQQRYRVSAAELQLAPTLAEAWPGLETLMSGRCLISSQGTQTLDLTQAELRRLLASFTVKDSLIYTYQAPETTPDQEFSQASQLSKYVIDQVRKCYIPDQRSVYWPSRQSENSVSHSYFLDRSGRIIPLGDPREVAQVISQKIRHYLQLSPRSEEILTRFEKDYRLKVPRPQIKVLPMELTAVLKPKARICFTGTSYYQDRFYRRAELEEIAYHHGLYPVKKVDEHCEALIAADIYTQSLKARRASRYAVPVFSTEDFLNWCG